MRMRILLALAFCLALPACDGGPADQPKFAVVDVARLMRDSEPGKAGVKFIESQQTGLQEKLDKIQDRLEKNPEDQAAMSELQKTYAEAQQTMQAESANVANLVYDLIQRALNSYRAQKGYPFIVTAEALAAYDPKIDVTDEVMAAVNKEKIEFKPAPKPAAALENEKPEAAGAEKPESGEKPASPAGQERDAGKK